MRLSNSTIAALQLPEGKTDKVFFDDALHGYGVRVRASGSKTYLVQYDHLGVTRRLYGGSVAVMKEPQARAWAQKILVQVKQGEDPAGAKAKQREEAKNTVGALVKDYLERRQKEIRPRSYESVARNLQVHAKPLHRLPIGLVDRRTIARTLDDIGSKSGPCARNRARSSLSAFFTWAAKEAYVDINPVQYTNVVPENGPRDRVLTDAELRAIWATLGDDAYSAIVKLLLLLGLRRMEIGGLRWDEVDLDAATITLPPERTKNKRKFVVPLPHDALQVVTTQPGRGEQEFVFLGPAGGFRAWTVSKRHLDRQLVAAGHVFTRPWSLHDFRRTISTAMNERLEIRPEVVESILGHTIRGVAGVYNRSEYVEERRRALQKWAEVVTGAESSKIVQLRA